ncbi:stage III sporulation protein AG [Anaerocolumna jejuensis]|uniref:stage III sporulation protein AG n=1 Tax=Anaerocolumna jejuensis TaxID=259063 RepID=UPI003F7BC2A4
MEKEKKKITLKEIGPARLVMLLMAGIFLVLLSIPNLPSSDKKSKEPSVSSNKLMGQTSGTANDETELYVTDLEDQLKTLLMKVEGIGTVEVMITLKGSKEVVVLKDRPYTKESVNEVDGEGGSRNSNKTEQSDTTVMVEGSDGVKRPYALKEIEPEVEGILVIAQGGEKAVIQSEIIEAVQVLFGVPPHKVKVMKMKS